MLKDEEVKNPDPVVKARQFFVRYTLSGRNKFPFKKMLVGDYFTVDTVVQADQTRRALQSFYNRTPGRRFTVRQKEDGVWYCRRVV